MEHKINSPPTDVQRIDTIYGLLSNHRRRHVAVVVSERASPIPIDKLASMVAARERNAEDGPPQPIEDIVVALHHVHLPKLDDAGVLDYDVESKVIVPLRTEALTPFLESLETVE